MSEEITRAELIPMNGNRPDTAKRLPVQFNPATLKVGLSNTLKADDKGEGRDTAAQFVDKSSSTLSVDLIFDTTPDNTDVRKQTKEIAERFMKPRDEGGDKPKAPQRCLFQWGAFTFEGMVETYDETLDFFAPEGIPLRATLSLKLKEDRYQFETRDVKAQKRATPKFSPSAPQTSVDRTTQAAGRPGADWRATAMFNGIESPRLPGVNGIAVPQTAMTAGAGASAGIGFRYGASARVGSAIAGAFVTQDGSATATGVLNGRRRKD
ncbi:MAG TPA: hypothetical protein VKA50_03450 [Gammaproteobacteria bacterium]|nr:hypothetical protein [Gammaproteobacteria bacterium]